VLTDTTIESSASRAHIGEHLIVGGGHRTNARSGEITSVGFAAEKTARRCFGFALTFFAAPHALSLQYTIAQLRLRLFILGPESQFYR
jgi:hypothetical protein